MNGQIHDVRNVLVPLISASAGFLVAYLWLANRPLEVARTASLKSSPPASGTKTEVVQDQDDSEDYSTDSDEEITPEYAQRLKNAKPPTSREECKLVLVVNQELSMTKGKIAAQCGSVQVETFTCGEHEAACCLPC
jgi:PTH2 family peptidyl-tRNA hydrolase